MEFLVSRVSEGHKGCPGHPEPTAESGLQVPLEQQVCKETSVLLARVATVEPLEQLD